MPFDSDRNIPRLHQKYSEIEEIQELSQNSYYHIANRLSLCIFLKVVEAMNNYLVTNLTGAVPANVKAGAIVLGEGNSGGNATLIAGRNNYFDPAIGTNGDPGENQGIVLGDVNEVFDGCTPTTVVGINNSIQALSPDTVVVGHNNFIGYTPLTVPTLGKTIVLGSNNSNSGLNSIALGFYNTIAPQSERCISLGFNTLLGTSSGNAVNSSISIGKATVSANFALSFGFNNSIGANCVNAIAIGDDVVVANAGNAIAMGDATYVGATAGIAIGATSASTGVEGLALGAYAQADGHYSVQIGDGSNSQDGTLKFRESTIANRALGIVMKSHSSAPAVTASDVGALALVNNVPKYVNSSGVLTNLGGVTSSAVYGAAFLLKNANITLNSGSSAATVFSYDTISLYTPAGTSPLPVSLNIATGVITFANPGLYKLSGVYSVYQSGSVAAYYNVVSITVSGNIGTTYSALYTTLPIANTASYIPIDALVNVTQAGSSMKFNLIPTNNPTTITIAGASSGSANNLHITKIA